MNRCDNKISVREFYEKKMKPSDAPIVKIYNSKHPDKMLKYKNKTKIKNIINSETSAEEKIFNFGHEEVLTSEDIKSIIDKIKNETMTTNINFLEGESLWSLIYGYSKKPGCYSIWDIALKFANELLSEIYGDINNNIEEVLK
jgi:hypothetical protein